jgi:predicted dehydrogenase
MSEKILESTLRVAVVGAGYMGRAHIQAVLDCANARLSAVVDPSPAAAELAATLKVAHHPSLASLLQAAHIDAVVLATPNALHVEQTVQCVEAGLAVLLEKPVATSLAQGEQLLQATSAVAGQEPRILVGHHRAHSAIMQQACGVIASGQLGRIVAIQGSALFYKPERYFESGPWRREIGGGPVLLNLIHEVHNLRMMAGTVVQVQALSSHAVRGHAVEDTVSIGLRFDSGVLASFLLSDTAASSRSWEQTSQENPTYDSHPKEDCYLITGTQGSLAVPSMQLQRYPDGQERSWWLPLETQTLPLQRWDPIARQMAHFVDVARGRTPPLVSLRDGLDNLRVTEAVMEAAHSGRTVPLN